VAIGNTDRLSHIPSNKEWNALYDMAKKQSLVGVCFAALQGLGADADDGFGRIGMSEILYLNWMGMAAKITQRNEVVNHQCAELQEKLSAYGFKSCILKGRGVAPLYGEQLHNLRQSGDIDALLWREGLCHKDNRKAVMLLASSIDKHAMGSEHHVHAHFFKDTDVELHYEPSYFCNPWANRRFRRWCDIHRKDMVWCGSLGFMSPNVEYNVVFLLSHVFRHYLSEGVGLRQLMDYYFVLINRNNNTLCSDNYNMLRTLKSLNMLRFASAVMWVMKEVFGMAEQYMICEPNERLGQKLLVHVMQGGNFGHHNTEAVASKNSHIGRFINQVVQDISLSVDYPAEALWAPISMIREFLRIRIKV